MISGKPITAAAIDAIAAGVFAKPDAFVVEAYSEPDRQPLRFLSHQELADYIKARIREPRGLAFVLVVYPDMGGRAVKKTIHLDPQHCPGQTRRYTWDGWGMISIQLFGVEQCRMSRIAANSKARADAWASTYPEWDAPDVWNWKAIETHTRRLQRIFKKVTQSSM